MFRFGGRIDLCVAFGLIVVLALAVILYWGVGTDQALIAACRSNNKFLVQTLLILGADVHATDKDGLTAFVRACERDLNPKLLKLLLENGGTRDDLNAALMRNTGQPSPEEHKLTTKHGSIYCPNSNSRNVIELLRLGADPNSRGKGGYQLTALMFATFSGNVETVRALLKAGADPNVKSEMESWYRALDCVVWHLHSFSGKKHVAENAQQLVMVLIENGAIPQLIPQPEPFAWIEAPVSEERKRWNKKILHEVRQAIEQGSSVDKRDRFGWTLLMKAAALGNGEVVSMLLQSGADVNARNMANETAMEIAESFRQDEIVALIQAHCAQ